MLYGVTDIVPCRRGGRLARDLVGKDFKILDGRWGVGGRS